MKIYRLDQFIISLALFLIAILCWKYDYLITSAIISLLGVGSLGLSFTDPKDDPPPKGSPEACAETIDHSIYDSDIETIAHRIYSYSYYYKSFKFL